MKTSEGVLRSCYNAQVAADNNQVIVAADVSPVADDSVQYVSMVEQASAQLEQPVAEVLVDGGYYSGRALKHAEANGYDLYMPLPDQRRVPQERFEREAFEYDEVTDNYRCPAGQVLKYQFTRHRNGISRRIYRASVRSCRGCRYKAQCTRRRCRELNISEVYFLERQMRTKLASPSGQARQARRKGLVEPVFGNLKFNLRYDRFMLRTLGKVRGEFLLMCLAHNLKKLAALPWPLKPVLKVASRRLLRTAIGLYELLRRLSGLDNTSWLPKPFALRAFL